MRQPRPLQIVSDGEIAWEEPSWAAFPTAPARPRPVPGRTPRRRRRRPSRLTILRRRLVALGVAGVAVWSLVGLARGDGQTAPTRDVPAVGPGGGAAAPASGATASGDTRAVGLTPVRQGDRGRAVKAVQIALATLGYDVGAPDGLFQGGTRAAVASFQQDRGLAANGAAGQATLTALAAALAARIERDARTVAAGIDSAVRSGSLEEAEGRDARATLARVVDATERLRVDAQGIVIAALGSAAANASDLDRPRTLALLGSLDAAVRHLQTNRVPPPMTTIKDADGIPYRLFAGHGFQFHPLAAFGALNKAVSKEDADAARRLARALVARAEPASGGLVWEYYFPFGGPQRWTSGFAQAVAANALQRASKLTGDEQLAEAAAAAYRTIPRDYLHAVNGGQWILEYSQSSMLILNAQLESLIMLSEYAEGSGNDDAAQTVAAMLKATRATLPRLDLGCWSLYSVGGNRATTSYHTYHVSLLRRLAQLTGDARFSEVATRWNTGLHGTC